MERETNCFHHTADIRAQVCEVAGYWRKLHNAELYYTNYSTNITRLIKSTTMRWGRHVTCMGHSTGAYRLSVRRPQGERPLGIPRRRWEENIKTDLFLFCTMTNNYTIISQIITLLHVSTL